MTPYRVADPTGIVRGIREFFLWGTRNEPPPAPTLWQRFANWIAPPVRRDGGLASFASSGMLTSSILLKFKYDRIDAQRRLDESLERARRTFAPEEHW